MAISNIDKVTTFFRGLTTRDSELTVKYIDRAKYTEHNPRAGAGVDGLKAYVRGFPTGNYQLKVVRGFEDGPYVFSQAEGLVDGENVFFDIFRFEDDLIVEHWVFSAKSAPPNQSGHTQTDGPTEANVSEDTVRNKSLVRDYYETIHVARKHEKIPNYFAGDHCIRHEPGVCDGVENFKRDLKELVKNRSIDEIKFVLGQNDFVFIAAKGKHESNPCLYVDLYRVENGSIAERWGFPEELSSPFDSDHFLIQTRANSAD